LKLHNLKMRNSGVPMYMLYAEYLNYGTA